MTRLLAFAAVATLFATAQAAPLAAKDSPPAQGADAALRRLFTPSTESHAGPTRCEACHTTAGWQNVSFPHERTGFPLKGAHEQASCRQCHPGGYATPVSSSCSACHRDVHQGAFGALCTSCHDESGWTARFSADAHRRTNFPLVGGHATVPCLECHQDLRDRSFSPGVVDCVRCHQPDYQRTAMGGVNHTALGFSTDCATCHDGFSFSRAGFPDHDRCFTLGGPHAGIGCLECHTGLTSATPGSSATGSDSCTRCHAHACERSDARHRNVPGYQCKDRKCYECHRFTSK